MLYGECLLGREKKGSAGEKVLCVVAVPPPPAPESCCLMSALVRCYKSVVYFDENKSPTQLHVGLYRDVEEQKGNSFPEK